MKWYINVLMVSIYMTHHFNFRLDLSMFGSGLTVLHHPSPGAKMRLQTAVKAATAHWPTQTLKTGENFLAFRIPFALEEKMCIIINTIINIVPLVVTNCNKMQQ